MFDTLAFINNNNLQNIYIKYNKTKQIMEYVINDMDS